MSLLVKTAAGPALYVVTFWSEPQEQVSLGSIATNLLLPDITVADVPSGLSVVTAFAIFKCRVIQNSSASGNALDGDTVPSTSQVIQVRKDGGTWYDAISFVDTQFTLAPVTRETGDVVFGSFNLSAEVDGNGTYNSGWLLAKAQQNNLIFHDLQVGLRISLE